MKSALYPINWLAAASIFLAGSACAAPTDEHQLIENLTGIWAEDCHGNKQMVIITSKYQAIVNDLAYTERAIALGRIEHVDIEGNKVRLIFSASFIHTNDDPQPLYIVTGKNEIVVVHNAKYWKRSDAMYRENPSERPTGYVSLDEHGYGMQLHRCKGDAEQKMQQIVKDNTQALDDSQ